MLDMACGAGRHSRYLAKLGFDVLGFDLSKNSIAEARKFENEYLKFLIHDMRKPLNSGVFQYIFSFFTSFGYFETDEEHQNVLRNIKASLANDGVLVIDFLNAIKVLNKFPGKEDKLKEGIRFVINKEYKDKKFVKSIHFTDRSGMKQEYAEKVTAFVKEDFESMFEKIGFRIHRVFGDYELNAFNQDSSDRLIILAHHA